MKKSKRSSAKKKSVKKRSGKTSILSFGKVKKIKTNRNAATLRVAGDASGGDDGVYCNTCDNLF